MDVSTLEKVGEILRMAAAQAVMPRFAALQPGETEMKSANEPVTIADREAEAIIEQALRSLLPEACVVGEEASSQDQSLLHNLGEGLVWIIDPIDGTANFAAGRPPFAMMVALLKDGEAIGAWILDPLSDSLAVAERGGGTWIGGKRVRTADEPIDTSSLEGIASDAFLPPDRSDLIGTLRSAVAVLDPTARCAGHEYPLIATGSRHFALYWRTLVWDHAPGALLLTEAGGSVTHLDGIPYSPAIPRAGLLLAHNPTIARALLHLMQPR